MNLVDSHCHLDFPEFEGHLDDVIKRASNAGVHFMMTICTQLSKFEQVLDVAKSHENIWCSVGVHPHNAASESETNAQTLISMAEHPKVVAFGETAGFPSGVTVATNPSVFSCVNVLISGVSILLSLLRLFIPCIPERNSTIVYGQIRPTVEVFIKIAQPLKLDGRCFV